MREDEDARRRGALTAQRRARARRTAQARRPTMIDIANEARVSQTTVSLVLNHADGARLSTETRERVRLSLRDAFPIYFGERWEEARGIYLDKFQEIHLDRLSPLPGREAMLRAPGCVRHIPVRDSTSSGPSSGTSARRWVRRTA